MSRFDVGLVPIWSLSHEVVLVCYRTSHPGAHSRRSRARARWIAPPIRGRHLIPILSSFPQREASPAGAPLVFSGL
jgi:hypothetical protein